MKRTAKFGDKMLSIITELYDEAIHKRDINELERPDQTVFDYIREHYDD